MGFIYNMRLLECLFSICHETLDEIHEIVFPRVISGFK